ncbi:MAG: hypothetical protein KIT18_09210 [Burkholderiales bacterium]|nr:hypothetical protein [Burkholderiales bacterium]
MKAFRSLLPALFLLCALDASASDTAKTMFGVELGSRFLFPPCARGEDALTRRHCYGEALTTRTPWGADEYHVFYPRPQVVPYARGELVVHVVNGIIEAIHVNTWGIQAQGSALEALTKKYGPPARTRSEKIRAHRSRLPSQFAEWDLRDFSVRFDGTTTTIDWGRITLVSHRYLKLMQKHAPDVPPR